MKRKLNSERGVALAFVIAAFAVVMVLGTVGVTAGYANLSKAFDRKDGKQAYYTLISAARLLREELDGAELVVTEQWLIPEEVDEPWIPMGEPVVSMPDSELAEQLLTQLANGAAEVGATVRIERAGYSQDIAWNICLDGTFDTLSEGESTRNAEMTLTCGGRTVSVEAHLKIRKSEQPPADDAIAEVTTTFTLDLGAIHEEASR